MIKIVFNFKCIYTYVCITCFSKKKKKNCLIIYNFKTKIMFNFKCIHAFALVTCLYIIMLVNDICANLKIPMQSIMCYILNYSERKD